ncbi:MAG: hypothetical protein ACXWZC_11690, partial [Actinomycetota bacterium]
MNVDERDTRLGDVLDRAVRGIEAAGEPGAVERRGSRWRAGVLVASVTAVGVFLGAVGFAATQVGRDAEVGWTQVGDLATDGWTISVPSMWERTPATRCSDDGIVGGVFSSVPFNFTDPNGGPIDCDSRLVLEGYPTDGVAIAVIPVGIRIGSFRPAETSFPLSLGSLAESSGVRGGPRESFTLVVVNGNLRANLRVYVGPDAPAASLAELGRSVSSLRFLGAGGTLASPDFAWTMPIPEGWQAGGAHSIGGPQEMLPDLRTSFVTTSQTAPFRGSLMVGSPLPSGIVSSDVIVIVDPFVGTGDAEPASLVLNAERGDTENTGWTWRDGKICGETGCARVYIWRGPDASEVDVATAMSVGEGVRMVETPPDPSVLAPTIDYRDGQDGFSMAYPAGWTVADENLTPLLASPHEILSVGTYPLRPGGKAPIDAYLPKNALADLGADDVFVTVQESDAGLGSDVARPSSFTPASVCDASDPACRDGTALGIEGVRAWWIPFTDPPSGRAFYAFVAMGEEAYQDPVRSAAAWAVLDSLSFEPYGPPISFSPAAGWVSETFAHRGSDPAMAWESNQPFSPGDARPSIPGESILALRPDGILVVAWEVLRAPPDPANANFPIVDLPLQLTEPEISYEGRLDPSISRSAIWAQVNGRYVQVWVFFGSPE